MAGSIATNWREIMGSNNWEGLLDPLRMDVRQNLLLYGDLVQVTGDAFNNEPASNNQSKCRYSKKNLFEKTGLVKGNPYKYEVTKYISATAEVLGFKESNWMGYVAVATDEGKLALGRRDIVIVWRGTVRTLEWLEDIGFALADASEIFDSSSTLWISDTKAHFGFLSLYKTARDQVLTEVSRLVEEYKNEEMSITVTGHSLGAALATLNAADIASHSLNKPKDLPNKSCPVTAIVSGSPKVGDHIFKMAFTSLQDLHLLRTRNKDDPVPTLPIGVLYAEMGEELLIDASKSPYLKNASQNAHNLQVYLHGIAGTQGQDDFNLGIVKRDLALINRDIDGLKDNMGIAPVSWWIEKNKGMVQSEDGSWKLDDHEDEDDGAN
ncbi:phospholipase A1-IIgamma [Cinnamomum micranthum f. kanehirae]|uniref:Phospholipase A1 n=1 Tax=Cinnamomum micranthum f. kanehirae TaxID=337451 RepID=A0A3S3NXH2_9MAGN|nr:phospholipase A1-IIgamma [Cinnamomum micranthum f. kanehirae]